MNLSDLIQSTVAARREAVFLIDAATGRSFTYGAFHSWALRLAADLRARGLAPGGRVGLLMENGPAFAALYFAALYAGVTAVPVNPQLAPGEVSYILGHAGLHELIYDRANRALLDSIRGSLPETRCLHADGPGGEGDAAWSLDPGPRGPAFEPLLSDGAVFSLHFTSGTTSRPKGVCHCAGGLFRAAAAFNAHTGVEASHRFYHVLPMSYMAGFLNTLLCPFVAGGSVVLGAPFGPLALLRFWEPARRFDVNALWLVPTMLAALLRGDRDPEGRAFCRDRIRLACVGTAPLPAVLQADFERAYGVQLQESYGLSETLFVAGNGPSREARPASVGLSLPGVEVQVRAEDGRLLPVGTDGEIVVRTPWNMAGYYDADRSAPAPLSDEWFASGDVGHLDADGYVFITARKKDLIIRGGQNISPRAVEEVLLGHPEVLQAAVIGMPHAFYGEEVVAVLVLRPGLPLDDLRPALDAACRSALSPAARPTRYLARSGMPLSVTGKLQKNKLREWVAAGAPTEAA